MDGRRSNITDCGRRLRVAGALCAAFLLAGSADAQHSDAGGPIAYHTFLSFDATNGVQIEYLDADGGAYLWYPERSETLRGAWRLAADGEICFVYPGYDANLDAGSSSGDWICMSLDAFYLTTLSKRDGDLFGLAAGDPPFTLRMSDYFDDFDAVEAAIERR